MNKIDKIRKEREEKLERIDIIAQWEKRAADEKHLSLEQYLKLYLLRIENEKENEKKKEPKISFDKKIGDTVYFNAIIDKRKREIGGIIIKINKNTFDISTGFENFKNIPKNEVRSRYKENLLGVKIPEDLKKIPTKQLLVCFKNRGNRRNDKIEINHKDYLVEEVKAELNTREHILRSDERTVIRKQKLKSGNRKQKNK